MNVTPTGMFHITTVLKTFVNCTRSQHATRNAHRFRSVCCSGTACCTYSQQSPHCIRHARPPAEIISCSVVYAHTNMLEEPGCIPSRWRKQIPGKRWYQRTYQTTKRHYPVDRNLISDSTSDFSVKRRIYTHSIKLSAFTVWRHTWRKNRVNCEVLTGSSAGLRTVLSSRLAHRELRTSLRESHSFLSLPADTTMA
jgi:hypothetical protein